MELLTHQFHVTEVASKKHSSLRNSNKPCIPLQFFRFSLFPIPLPFPFTARSSAFLASCSHYEGNPNTSRPLLFHLQRSSSTSNPNIHPHPQPIPLSTINITPSAHHPPPTAYPTGRGTGTGTASGTGGPRTANYTLLSMTLHYRTTLQTQRNYPTLSHPNNEYYHYPNATGISPPLSNGTGLPTPPPKICTPNGIYCDSPTSFSLCIPGAGKSTRYYPMGSVANGTICRDGGIERASDGKCTPDDTLSCSQTGQMFFSCDEGILCPRKLYTCSQNWDVKLTP